MRPKLSLLDDTLIEKIIDEALDILENPGISMHFSEGLEQLGEAGAEVDFNKMTARIPRRMVEDALKSAPSKVELYDFDGNLRVRYEDDNINFRCGGTSIKIIDPIKNEIRNVLTSDWIDTIRLVDTLEYIDTQGSLGAVCDTPEEVSDLWRTYLMFKYSKKPMPIGAHTLDNMKAVREMVIAIYGGDENAIVKKPIGIRSVCPSPPLKWSSIVAETALDAARLGIPVQVLPMGLMGANAPVTLVGTLVQHTAENLSGIVFTQIVRPGIPVVFGGSPIIFDMKNGTTPLGAIETQMLNAAYPQIGRYLGLPTQSFLGLSDSKLFDAQAGFETGIGIILGALTGTNMMQGVGQMYFESAFCNLKLVLDNDICGMAKRLVRGIEPREDNFAVNLMREIIGKGGDFLSSDHTRKWFKKECFYPSVAVDRRTEKRWITEGSDNLIKRTSELAKKLIESYKPKVLNEELNKELDTIMLREFKKYGMNKLPKIEI